jgi:hypothetical protein
MTAPRIGRLFALFTVMACTALSPQASADGLDVEVVLGGGSVVAWDALDEAGNGFAFGVSAVFDDFSIGLAGAAVLPDGRTQAQIGAFWAEGRWYPMGRRATIAPYILAGLGVATPDDFNPRQADFDVPRWVTSGVSFLAVAGGGARFGDPDGLWLGLDVRTYNHTHAGVALTVGFVL